MPDLQSGKAQNLTHKTTFIVEAMDTFFFRDGRPFDQTDEGLAAARSVFPPHPRSMAMGLRAAIARARGWSGWGNWDKAGQDMPGSGENQGGFSYRGPFLCEISDERTVQGLILPTPAHLGLNEDGTSLIAARPASGGLKTSLGPLSRLQPVEPAVLKPAPAYLYKSLVNQALSGASSIKLDDRKPDAFSADQLYRRETSVGLTRSFANRTAIKGKLYQSSPIRTRTLGEHRIGLVGIVEHAAMSAEISAQSISRFGGEARSAHINTDPSCDLFEALGNLCTEPDTNAYMVMLLTPLGLDLSSQKIEGLPGICVAAALPRQIGIGGWADTSGSLAHTMMTPPGTVLFMKIKDDKGTPTKETLESARKRGLGAEKDRALGYGEFIYGKWPIAPESGNAT